MRHIAENFRRIFKNMEQVELLWKTAYASTTERFTQYMLSIATISSDASAWIQRTADPIHWANAYFRGQRYGHMTSNIAESFNAWIMEAREQPIQIMFETTAAHADLLYAKRKK
jgi:zinc finger SWIM domain-containing protein 3